LFSVRVIVPPPLPVPTEAMERTPPGTWSSRRSLASGLIVVAALSSATVKPAPESLVAVRPLTLTVSVACEVSPPLARSLIVYVKVSVPRKLLAGVYTTFAPLAPIVSVPPLDPVPTAVTRRVSVSPLSTPSVSFAKTPNTLAELLRVALNVSATATGGSLTLATVIVTVAICSSPLWLRAVYVKVSVPLLAAGV
jgi:hypothetical protein